MSRAGVLPKAVIATLVGIGIGVTAGVWSLRQSATRVTMSASPAPSAKKLVTASEVAVVTEPTRARADAPPSANDDAHVLERARTLARRPDVTALMALRDDVVRRATERGIAGSSSIKSQLDEIDVRLNEARLLQLKLDAEELRKADSKGTR
jgi:hypothetical protein